MEEYLNHITEDEPGLYMAGHTAPAGTYCVIGTRDEIELDHEDILPATLDGRIAVYRRRVPTWAELQNRKQLK